MARRLGNVAPHDVHTTPRDLGLPMEERESREEARARIAAKRERERLRSPFARRPGTDNARSQAVPALDEQKFTTPPLEHDVEPHEPASPAPAAAEVFERPSKGDGTRRVAERLRDAGYAPHEVREWAAASGVACPVHGVVPARVVDAFLADVALAREASRADEQPSPDVVERAVEMVRREAAARPAPAPDPADEPIPYVLAPTPLPPGGRAAAVTALLAELAEALADDLDATDELTAARDAEALGIVGRTVARIRQHTAVTRALLAQRTPTPGDPQ